MNSFLSIYLFYFYFVIVDYSIFRGRKNGSMDLVHGGGGHETHGLGFMFLYFPLLQWIGLKLSKLLVF